MVAIMRAKGTGTYGKSNKLWRLQHKRIQATIGQLEARYGVKFRQTEPARLRDESAPYWRRYLQEQEEAQEHAQDALQHAQAVDAVLGRVGPESPLHAILQRLRATPITRPDFGPLGSIEAAFLPVAPTDHPAPQVTIATEAKHALQVHLERTGKTAYYHFTRQALDLLTEVAGQLEPHQLQVDHWREFFRRVKANPSWGPVTQANMMNAAKRFAKTVSQARGVNYGFVHLPEFLIDVPEAQKTKYTVDEVTKALQHATGLQRLQVLLGLNAGMTNADILTLRPHMLQDGYIVWQRVKLAKLKDGGKTKDYKSVAKLKHKLWPQTLQALTEYDFTATEYALNDGFTKFARKHALPVHKALRKTVTQLLQDAAGNTISRHYRGEIEGGTHVNNYVERRLGDVEQAQLDKALEAVGRQLGLA
jgi:hypothetical protein